MTTNTFVTDHSMPSSGLFKSDPNEETSHTTDLSQLASAIVASEEKSDHALPSSENDKPGSAHVDEKLDFADIKLVGRERELQMLHDVYSHVNRKGVDTSKPLDLKTETSCAMIRGISGTGKSTLVKQFIDDLNKKSLVMGGPTKPLFLSGKFDELSSGDPFSAIVEAFSGFSQSLSLHSENRGDDTKLEVERIRTAIQEALGDEARVMATMVPSLRHLIVSQEDWISPVDNVPSDNTWNRLKYIFQVFSNAISTERRPVVMFLDDLQWSDSASLELLEALLTDKDLRYFMFVGSYRSNEVQPGDELMTRIGAISMIQGIKNIELNNLSVAELNDFITDALSIGEKDKDRAIPLREIIYSKTNGNIFFAVQLLEELERKNILLFSRLTLQWEWNLEDAGRVGIVSDDVIAAVTSKIMSTPDLLQKCLILISYLKSTVDVGTIQSLLEMDGYTLTSDQLTKLLEKGVLNGLLTNRMGSESYALAHDRIQQACHEMIPCGKDRDEFRFKLGRRLLKIADSSDKNWILFAAADHLNATCMQLKSLEMDVLFLTKINLQAGTRAASVAAFETASKFLGLAIGALLQRVKDPWEKEYDITLRVYEGIVSAELCQGHFEVGHGIAAKVLANAKKPEDKIPTYIALSKSLGQSSKYLEAYQVAGAAARELGILPKSFLVLNLRLIKDMAKVKKYFKAHSDEEILALPVATDRHLIATMKLLYIFSTQAYYCKKSIESLAGSLKQLRLTFKHGLFPHSAIAMISYCLFSQAINDVSTVERCIGLARGILQKLQSTKEVEVFVCFLSNYYVNAWKDPHASVFAVYERGEKAGMEAGDFENGLLCPMACLHYKLVSGFPLQEIDATYVGVMERLVQFKVASMAQVCIEQHALVRHLIGVSNMPPNFEELGKFGFVKGDRSENYPLIFGCLSRIQLGIHFGKYRFAERMIDVASHVWDMDEAYTVTTSRLFLCAIVYATLARETTGSRKVKREYLKKARKCSGDLKGVCKLKGMKCYHRHLLAEAQIAAAEGSGGTVPKRYEKAIAAAHKNDHIHDVALGGQLAAEYFLDMSDDSLSSVPLREARNKLVQGHLARARDMYLKWGAKGVVYHLESKYKKYLEPTIGLFDEQSTAGDSGAITFNSVGEEENYGVQSVVLPKSILGSHSTGKAADEVSVLSGMTEGVTGRTWVPS